MSSDERELNELERSLAGLCPSPGGFDRDRLMFQAGQAAAHGPRRLLWPAATALATGLAVCFGVVVLLRPDPAVTLRVVYVDREVPVEAPAPRPPESPPAPDRDRSARPAAVANLSYWQLHELAVRHGIDALPEPAAPTAAGPMPVSPSTSVGEWRSRPGMASSLFNAGVE
jgi:hypothetical protein